jgi:hypothetical protein
MDVITTYLDALKEDMAPFSVENLIKFVYSKMQYKNYHHRIHFKKYPEDNLVHLFTESSQEHTEYEVYNACRSVFLTLDEGKLVSYSHSNLEYLTYSEADKFFTPEMKFSESHEGTLISVFSYNGKWYYATRRNISMYNTHQYVFGKKSELSHGKMFEEALTKLSVTKEELEKLLNPDYQYYIELVHNQNKFNISYESRFGDNYAKLFLLFVRDKEHKPVDISTVNIGIEKTEVISAESVKECLENKTLKAEGYIFVNGTTLSKVLHPSYNHQIGYKTKQELYIDLYQKDKLAEYVKDNDEVKYNNDSTVETIGLVTSVFTYVGQRMLDIYFKFNNNNMVHRNEELFKKLFMDEKKYQLIFFNLGNMKGIHKNKPIDLNEMRKFLKYKMDATNLWKLGNEIRLFESEQKMFKAWTNPVLEKFWV